MHHLIVRVWLPDRPGALGQVASRIGAVKGDVVGLEILERGAGNAIDELVVVMQSGDHVQLLIDEVNAVDGVSVEHVREIVDSRTEPSTAALSLTAEVAEAQASDRLAVLLDGLHRHTEVEWSAACRDGEVIAHAGDAPEPAWLVAFAGGSHHLHDTPGSGVGDVLATTMARSGTTVMAGRESRPIHASERTRFSLLVRIADALIDCD